MRDLFGATLLRNNEAEDKGQFTDGFWDQEYQRPASSPSDSPKPVFVESEMKDGKWWGRGYAIRWENGVPVANGPGVPFKYDTVDIPYRKVKNKAKIYFLFDMDEAEGLGCFVTRKAMDEMIEKNGGPKRKIAKGEDDGGEYFSIPVEKVQFIERGPNGKWRYFRRRS